MVATLTRIRLLTLTLALALLAGCVGSEGADVEDAEGEDPIVFTSPTDDAPAGNASRGSAPHLHDYWGGRDRLVVLDAAEGRSTFIWAEHRDFVFRPEAGAVVPQGTARVDVTVSWTDREIDNYGGPELWVKTAEENDPFRVGELAQGETLSVAVTNAQNDIPHQALSAWMFVFRVLDPGTLEPIRFAGEIEMRVEAHRGLEIPLFPGHPDHWGSDTEKHLFEETVPVHAFRGDARGAYQCFLECPRALIPEDGAIVPPGTDVVEVEITQTSGSPFRLGLHYHGANTREWATIPADEDADGHRVFRIPVERGMADGPYATQSLWEFLPFAEEPAEDTVYAGEFTVTARALRTA